VTRPSTVLIIDDSEMALCISRAALEGAGYTVLVARNLAELTSVQGGPIAPDLILMDVQMPEAFGDDIATVMRECYDVTTPILLYSSLDEHELAERAAQAGVDGFVCKRAGVEAMVHKVTEVISGRGGVA
jgi:DNA-binding response OmpR family regulator